MSKKFVEYSSIYDANSERLMKIVREKMNTINYYFIDISEVIARKLDLEKDGKVYYFKTILDKSAISKKTEELKLKDETVITYYLQEKLSELAKRLCDDYLTYPENVDIVVKDGNIYVYFHKKFLRYQYWVDYVEIIREIVSYAQKIGEEKELYNYEYFERKYEKELSNIYLENTYHPIAEKMLSKLIQEAEKLINSLKIDFW